MRIHVDAHTRVVAMEYALDSHSSNGRQLPSDSNIKMSRRLQRVVAQTAIRKQTWLGRQGGCFLSSYLSVSGLRQTTLVVKNSSIMQLF